MNRIRNRMEQTLNSELFTYGELRKMFLTLLLDSFFIFLIGVLSSMLLSSVGEEAMAATSLVGTVNGMVSIIFSSLASGGAIAVARAKGRGDVPEIQRAVGEVTGICFLTALALSAGLYLGAESVIRILYPDVDPLVREYAVRYMRLMCISFLPFSVFNAIFNIFRNLGDTRSSLMLTIVINVSHLLLSILFINGLRMGITGAGLSYIVARTVGMALALLWILKIHNVYGVRISYFFRFRAAVTRDIFSLGMPLAVESLLLQGGMLLVNIYLARLSTMDMAAHARTNAILNLYQATPSALTSLVCTVCGQAFGAGRYDLIRMYGRNLLRIGRWLMAATVLILYPMTPLLLMMYNVPAESVSMIYLCLGIAAVGMPLFNCDTNVTAMVLRVAGDGAFTGACAVIALAMGRCALGYLLTITLGLGVPGIWISLVFEWILRSAAQHLRLRGDRWLHVREPEAA